MAAPPASMPTLYRAVAPPWPGPAIVGGAFFTFPIRKPIMIKCPRCGALVDRVQFPAWLRPVRVLIPHLKRMRCVGCGWRGFRR